MDIHPSFPAICSTILTQAYSVGIIAANRLRTYICPTQDHITLMNVKAACRAQQPRGDVGRHENGAWLTWRLDLAPGGRGLLQEVSPTAWLLRSGCVGVDTQDAAEHVSPRDPGRGSYQETIPVSCKFEGQIPLWHGSGHAPCPLGILVRSVARWYVWSGV